MPAIYAAAFVASASIAVAASPLVTDAGAASAAGVAIITFVGLLWRAGRRVFTRLVDVLDERIERRTAPLAASIADVRAQLSPNSGQSTRDAIDRIASATKSVELNVGNVELRLVEELDALEGRLNARLESVEAAIGPNTTTTTPGETTP